MNKNLIILIGGALAMAIVVAVVVQSRLAPKEKPKNTATTEVLVANKVIPLGKKLKKEDVRWQSFPNESMFKGLIKKSDQKDLDNLTVYDAPVRRTMESGEPITMAALIADTKGTFLSALISPGMRAVSVPVSVSSGAGGFIGPGDRVDVLLTYTPKAGGSAQKFTSRMVQKYATQILLQDVRVLAIDQNSKEETRAPKVAKTVTLEVSQADAQRLILADKLGSLTLFLRRIGEKVDPKAPPPLMITDLNTSDIIRQANTLANESKMVQQNSAVRMYNGNNIQNIPVRRTPQEAHPATADPAASGEEAAAPAPETAVESEEQVEPESPPESQ